MKIFYLRTAFITFLSLLISFPLLAQRSNGIAVEGKISVQQGLVEGAIIQMFIDGRRMDNYGVGADGRYKVELNYNHKYVLIFTLEGNFSQKIVVESDVPKEVLQSDPRFPPFPLDINLFTEIPGIDKSFTDNTIQKIYYNPSVDNFISELYYNDAQIAKLIEQAVLQSQVIGKEANFLSKLSRAELAEMRKEYDELIEQASNEYSKEQFLSALDGFKAASKIFPDEQFPKDRIAEINDLLGLIMVAAELDKAKAERFDVLIKEADALFSQKKYNDARNSYNRALSIKPTDTYASGQISIINDLLKKQLDDTQYENIIALADNSFKQLLYNEAAKSYQEALSIKPNQAYPKQRLEEIDGILANAAEDAKKKENYEQAMKEGEVMFQKQFYEKALASFENALSLRPGDELATRKAENVKTLMKNLSDKLMYDKLIATADRSFKREEYKEALKDYTAAESVLAGDKYATQRIVEITQKIKLTESFANLISDADMQFNAKNYQESKDLYTEALEIVDNDKHSLGRIKEIDVLLEEQGVEEKYNSALTMADEMFNTADYENAKGKYNEASEIKPKEKYPKDKVAEINNILSQIVKNNQDYQKAISKAEELFNQQSYENAKVAFTEAGRIKPDETYPAEMTGKIDNIIAEQTRLAEEAEAERIRAAEAAAVAEAARLATIQAEKDKNYKEAVTKADNLFKEKDYENARNEYRAAQTVKPDETYPQQKIEEIGNIMTQLSVSQKAYETAIAKADKEFQKESFEAAKLAYGEAQKAKPDETYPGEMIAKINSTIETRATLAAEAEAERLRLAEAAAAEEAVRLAAIQAEKDKNYKEAVTKADNLFKEKDYENARNEYRTAQTVKPEETYPQQKIEEIGTLMAQLSIAQKAYEKAIAKADKEFQKESFDAAKLAYSEAQKAKPDETYPGEMIAKINSTVETRARLAAEAEAERLRLAEAAAAEEEAMLAAIQAEKDKNYNEAISKADNFFTGKDYENARNEYRAAQNVKPEESYPQQKIEEIGTLLAQLSAAQKAYETAISKADKEFQNENFDAAKLAYGEAQKAKPDESYPAEMITKIDSTVETRARLAAEAEAEQVRLAEAAAVEEAARLAAIQAEKDKNYNEAITKADNLFNQKNFESARNEYRTAQTVKPEEVYAQQKIDEIGTILAELSASQKAYEDAVANADREFKNENFDAAKLAYGEAQKAKPDESYPAEMIAKIDSTVETRARLAAEAEAEQVRLAEAAAAEEAARLAAIQVEKDKNYNEAITKADNLFEQKDFENARNEYSLAQTVKPEEAYPKQKIEEIGALIAQLTTAQKAYDNAVTTADSEFQKENFDAAKLAYSEALKAKPTENYPEEMIAKINLTVETRARLAAEEETERLRAAEAAAAAEAARLAAIRAEKDKNYNLAITKADSLLEQNDYEKARNEYRTAQTIIPEETYPRQKLAEIEKSLAALAKAKEEQEVLDKNYSNIIQQADRFFTSKSYEPSKEKYNEALDLKPDESYPKLRITEIEKILQQQIIDEEYRVIIVAADGFFKTESYLKAKTEYEKALTVKAEEQYPKNQIAKIDDILQKEQERILAEKQAAEDLQRRSNEIALLNENLEAREVASDAELKSIYDQYIKQADQLFDVTQYIVSRGWYYKAWDVKPDENYPKQRIDEINRILQSLMSSQLDRDYQKFVDLADSTFRENQYAVARGWYNRALGVKANEQYPKNQLQEIQNKIAERMAGQSGQQFESDVQKAAAAFDAKNYNVARFWYKKALELRPDNDDVKSRLIEIENAVK